jgi:hypothetical protein
MSNQGETQHARKKCAQKLWKSKSRFEQMGDINPLAEITARRICTLFFMNKPEVPAGACL